MRSQSLYSTMMVAHVGFSCTSGSNESIYLAKILRIQIGITKLPYYYFAPARKNHEARQAQKFNDGELGGTLWKSQGQLSLAKPCKTEKKAVVY